MTTTPQHQPQPATAYPKLTLLPDPPSVIDGMLQQPFIARADQTLRSHFYPRTDVLVSGDGYLCRYPGEARRSPNLDCIVAIGLSFPADLIETEANGYTISEVGKPPDFVLEVASNSTRERDNTVKREQYAALEVGEYWRYAPHVGGFRGVTLVGERLEEGRYVPIPLEEEPGGLARGYSAALGLELHAEPLRLRFWNPDGQRYLPDLTEAVQDLAALREAKAAERAARQEAETQVAVAQAAQQVAEEQNAALRAEIRRLEERRGSS